MNIKLKYEDSTPDVNIDSIYIKNIFIPKYGTIILDKEWRELQILMWAKKSYLEIDGDKLSPNDSVLLYQKLVNDPFRFIIMVEQTPDPEPIMDPNIDENGDGIIQKSEILDADDDGDNDWQDVVAIGTGNVVD